MVNIKVAVRIRPLSERELLGGEEIVVRKEDKSVLVTNPKIPERQDGDSRQRTRRFTVDFCYDSTDAESSSQEAVYKEIGAEVVQSMYEGYNACVLAYGHSASGKTYTIMGLQSDPGLTPRLCEGLFDKLRDEFAEGRIRVQIVISFLEIYNEKVRDLLGSEETGATGGNFSLRVREHPKLGPYVQGLSEHSVADKRELLQLLTTGNRRRSTAATESNIHSSRSHALFTIHLKRSDGENYETEKSSKVHLVDLAGSERARASQSKARLQEGANINKSLATLGNVICALAESYDSGILTKEHSTSKTWHPFVPYRDSVLTWLLKDTLGGNSNTIMIATISPASSCISETVNTLRYAKRAKKIVNQAIVNEDPKIRTIRELREEIARLRSLLVLFRPCGGVSDPWDDHLERAARFPCGESKWPEPEGKQITIKEENRWTKETSGEGSFTDEKEVKEDKKEEEKISESLRGKGEEAGAGAGAGARGGWRGRGRGRGRGGVDACEISDEKKSDVNGSVNDNFSHETQFFSDSLESLCSLFLKSGNSFEDEELEKRMPDAKIQSSCEKLREKAVSEMLHRSRPDLIKGISTRGQENGLPLGSSHSCTDVSNLSHSTSENSLNSSGSADVHPSENRSPQNPRAYNNLASQSSRAEKAGKNSAGAETSEAASKKKEKRSEAAEPVTSRLYAAKKKPDHKTEVVKKDDNEIDCGEIDELKLCKRARMKLFDLSRKLAMSRKMKKTVDSDTQTDCVTGTVRMKEKCVTTEPSAFDAEASEERPREGQKPYVIMNQVFIPRASKYVVECGEVVRVEGPQAPPRHESATQTSAADKRCRNADTSPIEFGPCEEDCFSEDSLDLEVKSPSRGEALSGEDEGPPGTLGPEARGKWDRAPNPEVHPPRHFEKRFMGERTVQGLKDSMKSVESGDFSFNGLLFPAFVEHGIISGERVGFFIAHPSSNASELRKAENASSENSFASTEGTENNSLSETSSEDFAFYENPKDLLNKSKGNSDRELYTITENSEQSDPGDAFSPIQLQRPPFKVRQDTEKTQESNENAAPRSRRSTGTEEELGQCGPCEGVKEAREVTPSPKCGKPCSREGKTGISGGDNRDDVLQHFQLLFDSQKTTRDNMQVPKSRSSSPSGAHPVNAHRLPNTTAAYRLLENFSAGKELGKTENGDGRAVSDFQFKPQKQYLNLNISSRNTAPPFSVDTHLFGKAPKGDQSTDTMSTSADSITFVFMGPAKPKTSVLMEIIGRSLGRSSLAGEAPCGHRKSRSRGVQCDASLMRSVSVDTAMIALSRIARNQEGPPEMQRTTSLGKLDPDDASTVLGRGQFSGQPESSCHCGFETGDLKAEQKKCSSEQCSAGLITARNGQEANICTKSKNVDAEKPKKSVSWFGERVREANGVRTGCSGHRDFSPDSELDRNYDPEFRGLTDADTGRSNGTKPSSTSVESDLPERRVRFLKAENLDLGKMGSGIPSAAQQSESADGFTAFLKEATQLLRNLNSRSSRQNEFSEEAFEEFGAESSRKKEEHRKYGFKTSKKAEAVSRSGSQGFSFLERDAGGRWRAAAAGGVRAEESRMNMTWPRRRPPAAGAVAGAGKPPTGTKARSPRSLPPSRFESLHSNAFPNSVSNVRSWSQSSRTGSNGQSWNLSDSSVALGNSWFGETESRPPSSRSSYCNETNAHRDFCSPPVTSPKRMVHPRPNIDSVSDLETDLEECCRRLEVATEQDKVREKYHERRKSPFAWRRNEAGDGAAGGGAGGEEARSGRRRGVVRRRGGEGRGGAEREPCRGLWSRGCRSAFELDSFGPGSRHCPQLCMFCRKKDAEVYYSAVSLNSECSSGLCRLHYYGFCPCSPVKLNQVVLSPRAYMQRLLALRKQIVSDTKDLRLDRGEIQYRNCQDLSRLSTIQNFS